MKDKSIAKAGDSESKSFYLKMIGDYYRYIAESAADAKLEETKKNALEFYNQAETECKQLEACNSIRLGLALNFSVFHYEVMNDSEKACVLAQEALDNARNDIDNLDNDQARDAISIVELLKENLDLWKEGDGDEAAGKF